jgi:hypothetical protein
MTNIALKFTYFLEGIAYEDTNLVRYVRPENLAN